jgi:hypothetical protein
MNKHNKLYIASVLLFLMAFSTSFAVPAITATVTTPAGNNAYYDETQAIAFTYTEPVDGTQLDVNAFIYYSSTPGAFENLIIDANAMGGAGTCTDSDLNVATSNTCSYTWNTTGVADGNYYIDINIASGVSSDVLDRNKTVSMTNTIAVDKTNPPILTDITAKSGDDGQVVVNWTPSDANTYLFSQYDIRYSTSVFTDCSTATSFTTTTVATTTSSTITGLSNGVNYWFCVLRQDAAGNVNNTTNVTSATPRRTVGGALPPSAVPQQSTAVQATTAAIAGAQTSLAAPISIGDYQVPLYIIIVVGVILYWNFFMRKKSGKRKGR